MASADFCSVTFVVANPRAVDLALGSGGNSLPFEMALSPAPLATPTAR